MKEHLRRIAPIFESTPLLIIVLTVALGLTGLVMTLSASPIRALQTTGSAYSIFLRQALWMVAGFGAFAAAASIRYVVWRKAAIPLLILSVVLLALVLVPGVGVTVFGATRWLGLGPLRVQPSEIAKIAVVLMCALVLERRHSKLDDIMHVTVPLIFPMLAGLALLILLEPDLGTTIMIAAIVIFMLAIAGVRLAHMTAMAGVGLGLLVILALTASYRRERMTAFLDPWSDASEGGYQVVQSLIAIGSGGPTGAGLGASRQKWSFLPSADTDFIFAILGEELGLIGAVGVLGLITGLVLLCVRAARRAPTVFGSLVAGGVGLWIGVQAFLNIGAVTGLLPVTGVPLPLMSVGGSNAVVLLLAIGIVVAIAREGDRAFAKAERQRADGLAVK